MGHLGEFCAEPGATIVSVGAALPRVKLIIIFGKGDFVRRLKNAKNKCVKYFYFYYEVIRFFFFDQKKAEKNARTIQ